MPRDYASPTVQPPFDDADEQRVNKAIRQLRREAGRVERAEPPAGWKIARCAGRLRLLFYEGASRFTSPLGSTYILAPEKIIREATTEEVNRRRVLHDSD